MQESKIHTWLFRCCKEAVESSQEQAVKDWMATRKEWWPPSKTNDYSRFRLSDFTDDVAALPQDELPVGFSLPCFSQASLARDPTFESKSIKTLEHWPSAGASKCTEG